MPIIGSDGRVLGQPALYDKQPLGNEVLVDRIYRVFLARLRGDGVHAGAGPTGARSSASAGALKPAARSRRPMVSAA